MPIYCAYGLALDSSLLLPELLPTHTDAPQITLRLGEVTFAADRIGRVLYKPISTNDVIVHYQNIGTARVSKGAAITLNPAAGADPLALRLFVLQQVFGVLLLQRGLFVLHSSAASVNGHAVAFAGPSGEGKSTLVAALNRRGCPIITDDVLAIDTTTRTAIPGLVQLKLTEEARECIAPEVVAAQAIGDRTSKKLCELRGASVHEAVPLRSIYLLETGATLEFVSISPAKAAIELVRHTYGVRLLQAIGLSTRHFQQAVEIARHVPVAILRRPRDLALLSQIIDAIKQRLPLPGPSVGEFDVQKSQTKIDPTAAQIKSSLP